VKVPAFSGLQPAGLQRGGEAPCGELENTTSVNFRKFPVFSSGNFAGLKNVGGFRLPLISGLTTVPVEPGLQSAGSYKFRLRISNG